MAEPLSERVEVNWAQKSVGMTTQNLPQVLIICLLGAFGYFMAHNLALGQERGFGAMAQILEKMNTHQQGLIELVQSNRQRLTEDLGRQNQLVDAQTQALRQTVDDQTTVISAKFDQLTHSLVVMSYNMGRDPSDRLPLDTPCDQVPPRRQEPRR